MIIITPEAGLCNRMRALDSALALGQAADVPVSVVWPLDPALNCRLERLFDPLPGLDSIEYREEPGDEPSESAQSLRSALKRIAPLVLAVKSARLIRKTLRNANPHSLVIDQKDTQRLLAHPERLVKQAKRRDLYIDTFDRFFRGPEAYSGFVPAPPLGQRIDAFSLKTRNVIGVHIRRTDHRVSIAHSPVSGFIAAMEARIERDPTVEFFVSSDSPEVELRLEEQFPLRILRQAKKEYARGVPEGIEDAVVDLFCLASCRSLIGSYISSFSETAGELGRLPLEIVDSASRRTA